MTCSDCGEEADNLFNDPRLTPLEVVSCLCADCAYGAYDDVISAAEDVIQNARNAQKNVAEGGGQ